MEAVADSSQEALNLFQRPRKTNKTLVTDTQKTTPVQVMQFHGKRPSDFFFFPEFIVGKNP